MDDDLLTCEYRFMNESHYIFVYWLVGSFFDDVETLTLSVGVIRSFESVGSCLSFGLGAARISPMANLIVAFVVFVICIPPTLYLTWLVPEHPQDIRKQLNQASTRTSIDEESSRPAA